MRAEREYQEAIGQEILKKAKSEAQAFVFDVDGTIKSSSEPEYKPLDLIAKILSKGKKVGMVTASGVSVFESFLNPLTRLLQNNHYSGLVHVGIANGSALFSVSREGIREQYRFPLDFNEVQKIVLAWEKAKEETGIARESLSLKGTETLQSLLEKNWEGLIPADYLKLAKEYQGRCFLEELKATFVMPDNRKVPQKKLLKIMQKIIDRDIGVNKYKVERGDYVFAHVTKWPGRAPKLFALKKIQELLSLNDRQILVFGDMPFDNDKGLLISSCLPFTFTSRMISKNPPYLLPGSGKTPVASVYQALDYLLLSE